MAFTHSMMQMTGCDTCRCLLLFHALTEKHLKCWLMPQMLMVALYIRVKMWEQPSYPSTDKWTFQIAVCP